MGTSAQDEKTQKQASTGAQANDQQLAANAAKNQQFSDQTRTTLFGTYNPQTNQYEGGTESKFLDPSSLDTKELTGAYKNEYNTVADQNAKTAQRSVGTTMENLASHGMGQTPAGFAADQQRKAYQDQADSNAGAYSNLFGQQHGEAVNQYNNANSMLSNNSQGAANLSLQGNNDAAGNYSGLYGTASQQKQNALGFMGQLASSAAGAAGSYFGAKCWIAAEVFGGWHDPRTVIVRHWVNFDLPKNPIGALLLRLYIKYGERIAARIRTDRPLRWIFTKIFNRALKRACEAYGWQA